MKHKHTPGPWLVDRNSVHAGQIAIIHGCKNNDWIEIWSTNWPDSQECQEANVSLMLAAPDLLKALKGVIRVADRDTIEFYEAKLAISKAEREIP